MVHNLININKLLFMLLYISIIKKIDSAYTERYLGSFAQNRKGYEVY
jgi:hypothetical protein